jgi:hypothetical protein
MVVIRVYVFLIPSKFKTLLTVDSFRLNGLPFLVGGLSKSPPFFLVGGLSNNPPAFLLGLRAVPIRVLGGGSPLLICNLLFILDIVW